MKKSFIYVIALCIVVLTGCTAKGCAAFNKGVQFSDRQYHIEVYSGGKLIKTYDFKGILNDVKDGDGYYFFQNGKMIEVSGDLIIESKDL